MRLFLLLWLLAVTAPAWAHDGLDVEPPSSEAEAWSTIHLCAANFGTLIVGRQWSEIPTQATLSNQALRYLHEQAAQHRPALVPALDEAEEQVLQLFRVASRNDAVRTPREVAALLQLEESLAARYEPAIARATVYACPMCRGVHELDPRKPCFKCGMALVPRIIPASTVYNTPGQSSLVLTPQLEQPLEPGRETTCTLRLTRRKDGAAVSPADLLVVHTERLHLLIIDESLTDYHHEHPVPTETPGEYRLRFTPRAAGAYRVFADVVPALSNVQEYAVCDLPGAGAGARSQPATDSHAAEVDGLSYQLEWLLPEGGMRAREPVPATIRVTDAATGQPFAQLEPIMGTYAHIVAFHEDGQTVLHLHPLGAVPQSAEDRGGPAFTFQFYAPKPGPYRLFSQVQVDGRSRFAPFVVNVRE